MRSRFPFTLSCVAFAAGLGASSALAQSPYELGPPDAWYYWCYNAGTSQPGVTLDEQQMWQYLESGQCEEFGATAAPYGEGAGYNQSSDEFDWEESSAAPDDDISGASSEEVLP